MENSKTFSYSYSASENKEVEAIRKKYMPKEENKLDTLKRLDNRVQTAGTAEALIVGIVFCLTFGLAMCIGLEVIPGGWLLAVILGVIGTLGMLSAYFVYLAVARKAKMKYAPMILALADEISSENK